MTQRRALAAIVLVAGIGAGTYVAAVADGNRHGQSHPQPAWSGGDPIRVVQDELTLPQPCRPLAVGRTLQGFFRELARGGNADIGRAVAPEPRFEWFSVTTFTARGKRHFVTHRPKGIVDYASKRQRFREAWRLRAISVVERQGRGFADIGFLIERNAADFGALGVTNRLAAGKGAVACDTGRIFVWSMAHTRRRSQTAVCPVEPVRDGPAIACGFPPRR